MLHQFIFKLGYLETKNYSLIIISNFGRNLGENQFIFNFVDSDFFHTVQVIFSSKEFFVFGFTEKAKITIALENFRFLAQSET